MRNILKLGLDGVINHSSWPLRTSTYAGVFILLFSIALSTYYLLLKIFNHNLPEGIASIHILVTFGIGTNALFLGVIGNYLNRIYVILCNEAQFVVKDSINLGSQK